MNWRILIFALAVLLLIGMGCVVVYLGGGA